MIEKYYNIKINTISKENAERFGLGRGLVVGENGYLLTICESNIGNHPEVYHELKTLATKLIETGEFNPNMEFTIKIKQ